MPVLNPQQKISEPSENRVIFTRSRNESDNSSEIFVFIEKNTNNCIIYNLSEINLSAHY